MDTAIINFYYYEKSIHEELEIPLNITTGELLSALNEIYSLGLDKDTYNYYLISENPIAMLRGGRLLKDFGIHDGTDIIYKRQ